MTATKDFEMTIRLRNNHLKARRTELGLSVQALAKAINVPLNTYAGLETMKLTPFRKPRSKGWKKAVLALSEFHGCSPDELFPAAVLAVTKSVLVHEIDAEEMLPLFAAKEELLLPGVDETYDVEEMAKTVRDVLNTLSPMEEDVIRRRFGLDGEEPMHLHDVGARYNLSKERIRQVECQALDHMRNKKDLEEFT
jgi:transcriptional regulator with XRE-family HTH domain